MQCFLYGKVVFYFSYLKNELPSVLYFGHSVHDMATSLKFNVMVDIYFQTCSGHTVKHKENIGL